MDFFLLLFLDFKFVVFIVFIFLINEVVVIVDHIISFFTQDHVNKCLFFFFSCSYMSISINTFI